MASVRKRTDGDGPKVHTACMMKHDTLASNRGSDSWQSYSASEPVASPVEVFYVVQSAGVTGDRDHRLCSLLHETRQQADLELTRLRRADSAGTYSVWKSSTYIEPAEWLHRVVRTDGTLILPRLHGLEKLTEDA